MLGFIDELPALSERRIAVHVTGDALRQVRGGHPWVWDGSITKASDGGQPGDLAVIFDDRRKFAAIGLWDPTSPIAVRVLHQGESRTIDDDFFAEKILNAYVIRQALHDDDATTGYRLVHGENDGLPGLVIDQYDRTLVVKLDTPIWLPHLAAVVAPALELTDAERVVLRSSRRVVADLPAGFQDSPTIVGHAPTEPISFLENRLTFQADVERGQKTGHFLDQRDNRHLAGMRCNDADVLDVFCNTGGFSVYAAAGGARSVHSIDVSHHAIEATRHHVELNRASAGFKASHTAVVADAFEAMNDLADRHQRFDVVIVDPPSFAPNASSVPAAQRAYRRLTGLAVDLLADGGTLIQASCSSRIPAQNFYDLVTDEVSLRNAKAVNMMWTSHALDHPIGFEQGGYLKAIFADVLPTPH